MNGLLSREVAKRPEDFNYLFGRWTVILFADESGLNQQPAINTRFSFFTRTYGLPLIRHLMSPYSYSNRCSIR
jgi:hypothetical protein